MIHADNLGAFTRQRLRDRCADAARRAGDQRDLAFETAGQRKRGGSWRTQRQHLTGHVRGMFGEEETQRRIERSEEHTSELQSLMRISYAVTCLNKKTPTSHRTPSTAR